MDARFLTEEQSQTPGPEYSLLLHHHTPSIITAPVGYKHPQVTGPTRQ